MPESGVPSELIDEEDDYAFVGDITEVTTPFFFYHTYYITHSFYYQIILTDEANIYRNPYIIASGITADFDSTNLTFFLTPSQYINLPHTVLDCPISCFIDSESKKWKNKKPMPTTGTTISVSGALSKVKRDHNHKPIFELELDNIAYLNRQPGGSSSFSNRTSHVTTSSNKEWHSLTPSQSI
jgi:hypothetical protein